MSFDRNAAVTILAGFVLATFVAGRLEGASWSDLALPLWAVMATLPAVGLPARDAARLAFAVPLLLAVAILGPTAELRQLGYGVVIAAAFTVAIAEGSDAGRIPLRNAARLVVIASSARLFPFDAGPAIGLVLVVAGTLLLLHGSSARGGDFRAEPGGEPEPRSASIPLLFLCLALVLIAPVAPLGGALYVPAIALAIRFLLGGPAAAGLAALVVAIFVGRWAVAAVGVVAVARFAGTWMEGRRAAPQVVMPAAGAMRASLGPLLFWPGAPLALAEAAMAERLAFAGLLGLSLLARTAPAMLLVLTAALILSRRPGEAPTRLAAVSAGFAFAMLALVPSSGAIGAAFPTLLAWPWALALALAGSVALLLPSRAGALVAAAIPIALVMTGGPPPAHVLPVGALAEPGEAVVLLPPVPTEAIDLAISGVNVSGMRDGATIGTLMVMDRAGRGWRRAIRVGEVADWAAFREGDFFRTLNPRPRQPVATIEGTGGRSFLRGEGMIRLRAPDGISRIELAVRADVPPEVRIHVERMEVPAR